MKYFCGTMLTVTGVFSSPSPVASDRSVEGEPSATVEPAVPSPDAGDPVTEAFEPGSETAERDVEWRTPLAGQGDRSREDLDDDVEDRLEDIGYLE